MNDNNVWLRIEYYKATNGENCFSLPRRFGALSNKAAYDFNDSRMSGATV